MRTKTWVGISLAVAFIMTVGIIAFGMIPDNSGGSHVVTIIDNKSNAPAVVSPGVALNEATNATPVENTTPPPTQNTSNTVNKTPVATPVTQPAKTPTSRNNPPVQTPPPAPPRRVTRAS